MKKKVALIPEVTIHDGAYLSDYLFKKDYAGHTIKRKSSLFITHIIDYLNQDPHIENRDFFLQYSYLTDSTNITRLKRVIKLEGTRGELTDLSKHNILGWKHKMELVEGVENVYKWYLNLIT
ncbi:GDP-mannose 4,6-dehydratase [Algibacter mikhailovii]|uniref:GDP-mannose 4,6-dehydratase n=1 Tax=Algibacter mikhailovii TaxID=425498 RepID=UPI0024956DCB|nr:GDP-mannose 4,6-dehydratase [Algibacter mikhailovii]